jgi:hypothetical protein
LHRQSQISRGSQEYCFRSLVLAFIGQDFEFDKLSDAIQNVETNFDREFLARKLIHTALFADVCDGSVAERSEQALGIGGHTVAFPKWNFDFRPRFRFGVAPGTLVRQVVLIADPAEAKRFVARFEIPVRCLKVQIDVAAILRQGRSPLQKRGDRRGTIHGAKFELNFKHRVLGLLIPA